MIAVAQSPIYRAATFAALSACLAQPAFADIGETPRIAERTLVRFAETCEMTDGMDSQALIQTFRSAGFQNVPSIGAALDEFFVRREEAFQTRDAKNGGIGQSTKAQLDPRFATNDLYFAGPDGWVAIARPEMYLGLMNGAPFGMGHHCYFFGYGWLDQSNAQAAFASLLGENHPGAKGRHQNADWKYIVTGVERAPKPYATVDLWAVKGSADNVAPTTSMSYVIVHDTTVYPWTLEQQ